MNENLTSEKAAFIEAKTKEMFDYTIECLDRARTEGNNVLHWLFAVVVGGLGMVGTSFNSGFWQISVGALSAAGWAAWLAVRLLPSLRSNETMPPGNFSEALNAMLDEPEYRMRWREARGMDSRITTNLEYVSRLAKAVDSARDKFTWLPLFFVSGSVVAWLFGLLWAGLVWVVTVQMK
jgi:hypothetical protein